MLNNNARCTMRSDPPNLIASAKIPSGSHDLPSLRFSTAVCTLWMDTSFTGEQQVDRA